MAQQLHHPARSPAPLMPRFIPLALLIALLIIGSAAMWWNWRGG